MINSAPALVDKARCAQEPIHVPGCIQPHGILIVLDAATLMVSHVSANVETLLGIAPADAFGSGLASIFGVVLGGRLESAVRHGEIVAVSPMRFELDVRGAFRTFECVAHRSDASFIIELEPVATDAEPAQTDSFAQISMLLARMERPREIPALGRVGAAAVQKITGFDRVLVYRFDDRYDGEVIAEITNGRLPEAYLGLRFPASDIPEQARSLYLKSALRLIPDAGYVPVPLIMCEEKPEPPVDLSLALLRSVSPVHREYLGNMGVGASMSISIVVRRRLWGLIMCHHREPHRIAYATRGLCTLIGDVLALQLGARMEAHTFEQQLRANALIGAHGSKLAAHDELGAGLVAGSGELLELFAAQGLIVRHAGAFTRVGTTPGDDRVVEQVAAALFRSAQTGVAASACLGDVLAPEIAAADAPCGALLIVLGDAGDEYLLCFRLETVQTIAWGGDARAAVGADDGRLRPRGSFARVEETIRGCSLPWSTHDVDTARIVRQRIVERAHTLDRRRAEERIRYLATHDLLTQLPNRAAFHKALQDAIHDAERDGALLAVLFIDLDRFKAFNDAFGHATGDRILQAAADRLRRCVRRDDLIARFGADQFVVVSPKLENESEAEQFAGKILTTISEPLIVANLPELRFTASMGIAIYPVDAQDAETLVRYADVAMYRSKQLGRNNFHRFGAVDDRIGSGTRTLQRRMQHGLERDEFVPYFQPIVNIQTGQLKSMEALARWITADRGMLPPSQFIAFAEKSQLIVALGAAILRAACKSAALWCGAENGEAPSVSVNVSARQFADSGFLGAVRQTLSASGLPPQSLQVEITESLLVGDEAYVVRTLRALADNGIRIAIDDFGTGYSSLSYLKRLPVHVLKIDQSFIRDLTELPDDAAIVRAIIAMAHSLNLQVVAEGVQSKQQLEFLRSEGCDAVQGYLTGRPLARLDAAAYVERFDRAAFAVSAAKA